MIYLHLKFENAGLVYGYEKCKVVNTKHITKSGKNSKETNEVCTPDYFKKPIPHWLLGSVLRVLAGEIPVSHRKEKLINIKYNSKCLDIFDEIAKESYIKYDNFFCFEIKKDEKENDIVCDIIGGEMFHSNKYMHDSHSKLWTQIYKEDKSLYIKHRGFYTWNYFRRYCGKSEVFEKRINELSEIFGDNPLKYTFNDFIVFFRPLYEKYISLHGKPYFVKTYENGWNEMFFGEANSTDNTRYSSRTPLFNKNGILSKIVFNGDIICPIDTDKETENDLIRRFKNGKGCARLLDDGICYITGIEKYEPITNFKEKYERIL